LKQKGNPDMAQVTFQHLGYTTEIAPGATHHWWWNNAGDERVWTFSVDASIPLNIPPQVGASARVEVTRVEYRQNYSGGTAGFEREIHYWVKNVGDITANYAIHMATIRE
jgi:hypothetical protein